MCILVPQAMICFTSKFIKYSDTVTMTILYSVISIVYITSVVLNSKNCRNIRYHIQTKGFIFNQTTSYKSMFCWVYYNVLALIHPGNETAGFILDNNSEKAFKVHKLMSHCTLINESLYANY